MTVAELLSKLRSLGVKIRADNGDLCCTGPEGALTAELRAALSERKAEILATVDQASAAARSREPSLQRISRDGDVPLSFAQQRLWFIDQLEPGSSLYNVPKAFRVRGPLDAAAVEQSLNDIVRRHEVLRTTFKVADGQPAQNISPRVIVSLPLVDLTDRPEGVREGEALRLINEEARGPFDLSAGPLLRAYLVRLAAEDHILLLTLHHIVSDGWSMGILYRELSVLYSAFAGGRSSALADLPVQYADFAQWQRAWLKGEVLRSQVTYWKERLANIPPLQLPTDRPRPAVQNYCGARHSLVLSDGLYQALKVLSQRERASLFMTLLAAFNVLLCRYSGQQDIVIGTPIAGRNRSEVEDLIGFFVNTLVLRTDLAGDPTFRELLGRVRDAALDAYAHQDLPFEKLVEEIGPERNLGYVPLSQVMFAFQNFPDSPLVIRGCSAQPMDLDSGTAKFDLTLQISRESYGLRCLMAYHTDLFDHGTIARMLGHFRTLLEGIVVDPNRRVSELPILNETERHQILIEWNDSQKRHPKNRCVHEMFEAQAKRTPDAAAIVFEGQQLTYSELNARANQLAHYLRVLGVGPEVLVGLCMERSLEMIIGLLGILKAGGVYLPLDPTYPKERLAFMIADTQARLVLTQQRLANPPRFDDELKMVCLDSGWEGIAQESEANPANTTSPDSLVYVMYTSGSTGTPKGVGVSHRSVTRLVKEQNYAEFGEPEVFLQFAPLSFDASTFEIWGCLLNGSKLVVSSADALSPDDLAKVIKASHITTLWLTSALFHLMVDQHLESLRGIKQLLTGGDVLSVPHVKRVLDELPQSQLINGYGPTENTTFSCCYRITSAEQIGDSVPIGRPINNTQVYALDGRLNPVPQGIPGELYVGGDGLARGYFNNPELTAEKFIPHPFTDEPGARLYKTGDRVRYLSDGNIEFLGRVDHQVKIRGFRIEPGEIESVLARHPSVGEVVVVARQDSPEEKRLVGYVVTKGVVEVSALRGFLKEQLPDYMVPSAFVFVDSLPLTPSGKIDRRALPAPDQSRPELESAFVAPHTPAQELVARTWADVLKVERVGIYDNFFELGGHSLSATQVISRLRAAFCVDLPLRSLFEGPTVADLAERIETLLWAREKPARGSEFEEREETKL